VQKGGINTSRLLLPLGEKEKYMYGWLARLTWGEGGGLSAAFITPINHLHPLCRCAFTPV